MCNGVSVGSLNPSYGLPEAAVGSIAGEGARTHIAAFGACRRTLAYLFIGVERKRSTDCQNGAIDPERTLRENAKMKFQQ